MKETGSTHWWSPNTEPNTGATNESGFTGLPGGWRSLNGTFLSVGGSGYWWYSSEYGATSALSQRLTYSDAGVFQYVHYKEYGISVRCLRD